MSSNKLPSPIDSTKVSLVDFFASPRVLPLSFEDRLAEFDDFILDIVQKGHNLFERVCTSGSGPEMQVIDPLTGIEKTYINFASNDYLNLTKNPSAMLAAKRAIDKYGVGAGGVPLLSGTLDIHKQLSQDVAAFKGCEAALLYTAGFGMNYGVLSALLKENDVAILDKYVHASIVDGCKHTNVRYFHHNDLSMLESVLKRCQDKFTNKIVVVDGVYSMDGDIAPLDKIVELAHKYGALVMVDEAHATGVIGPNGRGTPSHFGLEGKVDIVAGTFSKGLGSVGGFVAGSEKLIQYLRFASRPYMFSTAMAPAVAAALIENLKTAQTDEALRAKLWSNIDRFKEGLTRLGLNLGNAQTAIFPVILGNDTLVKELGKDLNNMGIYSNQVVYPAVARDLARLRFSMTAGHTFEQIDKTLDCLEQVCKKRGVL